MKRYKVRILPSAYNDLKAARAWYRQHNPDLPKRFKREIYIGIERIIEMPFTHAIRYKDVRIANLKMFPYAIHYFVLENSINIIAVHHTAIDSEKWYDRI